MAVTGSVAVLTPDALEFLRERHLASLTVLRPDGTPHVTPVGFSWDANTGLARVITSGTSRKARLLAQPAPAVLCQVDGRRWLTLEGVGVVSAVPDRVAEAVRRYGERYRVPRENPARVALEITVSRVLGSASLLGAGQAGGITAPGRTGPTRPPSSRR